MGVFSAVAQRLGITTTAAAGRLAQETADRVVRDYSLAWPTPQLFGLLGGAGSNAGIPITPLSSLQAAAVYACVKRLSEDLGKLPVTIKRRRPGGAWEDDADHPLNEVLRRPNKWMTSFTFWRYMITALELRGNAIAIIKRGWDGRPLELIPVNWDRVSVLLSPSGLLFYNVSHPQIGWGVTFAAIDVIHIRGLTVDGGYLGMTPVGACADAIGLAIATQQHGAVLFRQGAQLQGVLKHPAKLSKEVAQRIQQSWTDVYGGVQNTAKTAILEEGMSFEKLTMTNEDSQFLQTRAFQVVEIARLFGVPPHKIGDLSKSTFASIEAQEQAYINDSLHPRAVNIEQECDDKVFFDDERGDFKLAFNFKGLLRGDLKSRSDAYGSALNNGWMSVNEVRANEDMAPIDGGDTYRVPVNTTPIDATGAPAQQPDDKQQPSTGGVGSHADPSVTAGPIEQEDADQTVF